MIHANAAAIVRRPKKLRRATVIGCSLIGLMWIIALIGPLVTPYDPIATLATGMLPPSRWHWLGTDYAGRDIFTRLIYSIRLAYIGGVGSIAISLTIGCILGLAAGYHGRTVDLVIMRVMDGVLILPEILILIMLLAIFGQGIWQIIVATGVVGVAPCTRFIRGLTVYERSQAYVEAADALGIPTWRILSHHVLLNIRSALLTFVATRFGGAILALSSLSFFGIGIPAPVPELGGLLSYGREVMIVAWWVPLGPILVLWITILAANMISDGVSERPH